LLSYNYLLSPRGYVYSSKLVSIGFAIASGSNNGYVNYIIAHAIAISCGALFTILYGKIILKNNSIEKSC